jgi:hypothetical protein
MLPNYPDTDPFLVGVINRDGSQQALSEPETTRILDTIDTMFMTDSVRARCVYSAPLPPSSAYDD